MLDDLKLIHQRDKSDALGVNQKQYQQLLHQFNVGYKPQREIKNVIVTGMGGSALGALLAKTWPGVDLPLEIVRGYELPSYVGQNSLVVASSYSGNTEETLSALTDAEAKDAMVVAITHGGQLAEVVDAKGYPIYELPSVSQPRYGVFYNLTALVELLVDCNLLPAEKLAELRSQADWLKTQIEAWLPTIATSKNYAKQIAQEAIGKSIVIYAGPKLAAAAYKWKIDFNENAKQIAWWNQYPEFNHNELLGWTKQPPEKPYCVIQLRSNLEQPQILKRFAVSNRLLSGTMPAPIVVSPKGDSLIQQLLWSVALGDFVSLYAAILSGQDPTPIDLLDKLKNSLKG